MARKASAPLEAREDDIDFRTAAETDIDEINFDETVAALTEDDLRDPEKAAQKLIAAVDGRGHIVTVWPSHDDFVDDSLTEPLAERILRCPDSFFMPFLFTFRMPENLDEIRGVTLKDIIKKELADKIIQAFVAAVWGEPDVQNRVRRIVPKDAE